MSCPNEKCVYNLSVEFVKDKHSSLDFYMTQEQIAHIKDDLKDSSKWISIDAYVLKKSDIFSLHVFEHCECTDEDDSDEE